MPRHRPHRRAGARRAHALRLSSGASGTDDGEDLRLFEVEIVEETIPDPRIESLPPADYRAMAHVAATLLVNPQGARAEAERLVARYPHIPTIQNHLTLIL